MCGVSYRLRSEVVIWACCDKTCSVHLPFCARCDYEVWIHHFDVIGWLDLTRYDLNSLFRQKKQYILCSCLRRNMDD